MRTRIFVLPIRFRVGFPASFYAFGIMRWAFGAVPINWVKTDDRFPGRFRMILRRMFRPDTESISAMTLIPKGFLFRRNGFGIRSVIPRQTNKGALDYSMKYGASGYAIYGENYEGELGAQFSQNAKGY